MVAKLEVLLVSSWDNVFNWNVLNFYSEFVFVMELGFGLVLAS